MEMCELSIRTCQIKCNRTTCLARAAADLGQAEFKTLRKIDPDTMFGTGYGIADRFTDRPHQAGDFKPGSARVDINLKVDRTIQRVVLGRTHGAEDPPHRGHVLGFLSGQDLREGIALTRIGALIDNDLHHPVTLVDCAGPPPHDGRAQTIQTHISKITLMNLITRHRLAEALVRQRVELAATAISAVAVGKLGALDLPRD